MKTYIPYSLLLAAAATGMAFGANTAYTTPVGYETLPVASGFNYLGARLHQPVVAAGTFETVGANTLTDDGAVFNLEAGATYVVEIQGSGQITQILGSAASGASISTIDNLSAAGVANGASYKIRKAATLASIFGETNSAGLTAGFGSIGGADVVFVSNGDGSFAQFYYDELEGWADVNGVAVTAAEVPIVYTDSLIISANSPVNVTVVGEVKTSPTVAAVSGGFNYLGSVYPAGATLASTFDTSELTSGFGSIGGADVIFVNDGTGNFQQFYFDELEGWADVNGAAIDATQINLESGVIFSKEGADANIKLSPPASYTNL